MVRSNSFGPDALIWIDTVTKVFLDIERTNCSMSLDGDASFLTDDMEHALLSHVTDLVDRHFPKLKVNLKAVMNQDSIFVSWDKAQDFPKKGNQWGNIGNWVRYLPNNYTNLSLTPPTSL